LSSEKALELHSLIIRITDLVEKIGNYFKDDNLVLLFEMTKINISSDSGFSESLDEGYRCCRDKLISDMKKYISENEKVLNKFFSKNR
jgi:hypothetical protein